MPHRRLGAKARDGYLKYIAERAAEEDRDAVEYYHEQISPDANRLFVMKLVKSNEDAMMKKISSVRSPQDQLRYDIEMKELEEDMPGAKKRLSVSIRSPHEKLVRAKDLEECRPM